MSHQRGEQRPMAKLTGEKVREIRRLPHDVRLLQPQA